MKLVRDRIPEIIIEDGRKPIYHIADADEYKRELCKKVMEELREFQEEPCLEEAADLLEVIYTLFDAHSFELLDIVESGMRKNSYVGAFSRGVILERVDD
jgi:predicted house-cleaning noncanonical NTP pyrophosphatase (MazG superfamily)